MSDENDIKQTQPLEDDEDSFEERVRRWGEYSYDDGDLLEFYLPEQNVTIPVPLATEDRCVLGRPSSLAQQKTDELENASPEGTLMVMSKEDRQKLIALSGESRDTRERALHGYSSETKLVDLEPYGAVEHGVSRRHAILERIGRVMYITDLRSVNGTRLNGDSLVALQRRIIRDEDELRLGKLVLKVKLRKTEEDDAASNLLVLPTSKENMPPVINLESFEEEPVNPASETKPVKMDELRQLSSAAETKPAPPSDADPSLPQD